MPSQFSRTFLKCSVRKTVRLWKSQSGSARRSFAPATAPRSAIGFGILGLGTPQVDLSAFSNFLALSFDNSPLPFFRSSFVLVCERKQRFIRFCPSQRPLRHGPSDDAGGV